MREKGRSLAGQIALVSRPETSIVRAIMNMDSGSSLGSYVVTGLAIVGIALGGSALYIGLNSRNDATRQNDRISELEQKADRLNGATEELQGQIRGLYNQTRSSLETMAGKVAALQEQAAPAKAEGVPETAATTQAESASNVAPAPSGKKYTVRSGDYPAKIAKANNITVNALMKANPGLKPDKLKVGQTLNLP